MPEMYIREIAGFKQFESQVGIIVRTRASVDKILTLSESIYKRFMFGKNFDDSLQTFLGLCYSIDQAKIKAIGFKATTVMSNPIIRALAYQFALDITEADKAEKQLKTTIGEIKDSEDKRTVWFYPKLLILKQAIEQTRQTRSYVNGLKIPAGLHLRDTIESSITEIDRYMIEMMEKLREIRKYGVKPSFFELQKMTSPNDAWVFWGYRDFMGKTFPGGPATSDNYVAQIALAGKRGLIDLRPQYHHETGVGSTEVNWVKLPFDGKFVWSMNWQGNLDLTAGFDQSLVRRIFEQEGRELEYHALRMQLMFCLYDLIAPIEVVATIPSITGPKPTWSERAINVVTRKKLSSISDLVVPRIRSLDNMSRINDMLSREVEEGVQETERRMSIKRRHEVTEHIRRLPEGHKASPAARLLAFEEFGIELQEGETFVVKHKRGKGDKITSHRALTRKR
ncbi:MAG: hypothetical protein ACNFW9_04845 [Candidatus Kerfeldbacteria bacterium]